MYKSIFAIVFALVLLSQDAVSQPNLIYPLTSSEKCAHVTNGTNKQILQPNGLDFYFGKNYYGDRRRGFFYWSLPDNVIPDGSTINSVRLYMHVSPDGHSFELHAILYSLEVDPEEATAQLLWQRTDWFNNQTEYHIGFAQSTNYTVDQTYDSDSDFANAIEAALSDDFFTLGVVESREVIQTYPFNAVGADIKLEINFTPPPQNVEVDQKRSDDITSIGTVGRWEGGPAFEPYYVPHNFTFYFGTQEALQGMQTLVEDPYEKYNRWEGFDDVTNHHVFDITVYLTELTSQFDSTFETITIRNEFLSAPGTDPEDDVVEFKDPWLIDYKDPDYHTIKRNRGMKSSGPDSLIFKERLSPFDPDYTTSYNGDVYQGVFLNQPYTGSNPVHYIVRAPQSQIIPVHGQNTPCYFQLWDGDYDSVAFQQPSNRETAVVFKQPDAEARALYKGHFVSSNSEATGANNGRRMVRDAEGILHAVYEDGGRIWYTHTVNDQFGQAWAPEILVEGDENDIGSVYVNPSIVEYEGVLHVAYAEINGGLDYAAILYRQKAIDAEQWGSSAPIEYFDISELITVPKPAIEIVKPTTTEFVVVSFNSPDEEAEIKTYYKTPTGNFTESSSVITGKNPSLSRDAVYLDSQLRLCYEHQGGIYLSQWLGTTWGAANLVSGGTWVGGETNPNISYAFTFSHMVWSGSSDELIQYIIYRTYRNGPGTPYYFAAGTIPAHPTVAANYNPTIFYEETGMGGQTIVKRWFDGEDWLEQTFDQGRFPSVVAHGQSDAIWTEDSSAPYRLRTDYEIPDGESLSGRSDEPDTLIVNKRFDFTFRHDTTAGHLTLEIQNLHLGKRRITLDDSLMRSKPVTIPPNVPGEYTLMCRFNNVNFPVDTNAVLLKMGFAIGNTTHNIRQLRLADLLPYNDGQYHYFQRHLQLNNLTGKSGRFKILFGNMTPIVANMVVRQDSLITRRLAMTAQTPGNGESVIELPKNYRLYQNYPNPFNPSTTFTFDLPKNSFVELEIYDISGRKVSTLVNQTMEAGHRQVVWDGHDEFGNQVASGMYFYVLKSGAQMLVGKMLLMR